MANLDDFVGKTVLSATVLREIWLPNGDDPLETFIKKTRNPYLAAILISIDKRQSEGVGTISLDDAIRRIQTHGFDGVKELVGNIDAADSWGGGVARGFWETGAYMAIDEIATNRHSGTSIGAHPSLARSLKMHGPQIETFDTSPEGILRYSRELRNAVARMKAWEKGAAFIRGRFGESFLRSSPMRDFLDAKFGKLRVGQLYDWSVPVCNYSNGNGSSNTIIYNPKDYPDALVVDILMKTTAVPRIFPLQRELDAVYADGGLYATFPIETVRDADLIFGFVLTYYLPKLNGKSFRGFQGELRQHKRDFAIMQKRAIERDVEAVAGNSPLYIAEKGDKYGKLILFMPDLSGYLAEDFFKAEELIEPGKQQTREGVRKFLDPRFEHEEYDPKYFLERLYISRNQLAKHFHSRNQGLAPRFDRQTLTQIAYEWSNHPALRIFY